MTPHGPPPLVSALYWLPKVIAAGARVPETRTVKLAKGRSLYELLDTPSAAVVNMAALRRHATAMGFPLFIRTDVMSAKHETPTATRIADVTDLPNALYLAAEAHGMAFGVPEPRAILLRRWLPIQRACLRAQCIYGREYRVFVDVGGWVTCQHPYWPQEKQYVDLDGRERGAMAAQAQLAGRALEDHAWSLDFAFAHSQPYLIDAAPAGQSWHDPSCANKHRWADERYTPGKATLRFTHVLEDDTHEAVATT